MRVLIVPNSVTSESVFLRLAAWSAAGLLEPFCWWPVGAGNTASTVRRIQRGTTAELPLSDSIVGANPRDVAVVAFHAADAGEPFDEQFHAHVEACMDTVAKVVMVDTEHPTECTMVIAPAAIAQPVPPGLFRAHRAANVYLAPEDRVDPQQPNQLLGAAGRFPAHAAHGLATIADLWVRNGPETPRVIDVLKLQNALAVPDPVRVARCFSRLVDFGFLSDHLAAAVFQAGDSWPNPDMTRFDRVANPNVVMPPLVDDFMAKHAHVLGLGEVEQIKLEPVPRLGLVEALRIVVREVAARLRRMPFDWAEQQFARMHDHVANLIEKAAPDDLDLRVRRWHDQPEQERSLRGLARYLDRPRPEPDPAVEPTWTDLKLLAFGLIDGSPMPDRVSQDPLTRGQLRAVVTDAHRVVPDPQDRPPASEGLPDPRACDPLNLDPRFVVGAPPEGVEPEAWSAPRRGTPVWMIGAGIAQALRTAQTIAAQTPEEPPPLDPLPKKARRIRRAVLFASILAAVGGYFAWTELDPLPRGAAFAALAVIWLLLVANAARKALLRERGHARAALQREIDILNAALLRGRRIGDAIRLERRYGEYLDWAEILGWIAHRPWVGEPLRRIDLPAGIDERALPAAFRTAVAVSPEERIEQLANAARTRLFSPSWLTGLYAGVDASVWSDAGWHDQDRDRPNAAADTSEDPQSPRRHLLRAIRRGDHRHLRDNDLAEGLLEFVDQLPLDHAAHTVTTADEAHGAGALPPSAAWFSPPGNLPELSRRLRPCVVRVVAGRHQGTGLVVEAAGTVATALHVVADQTEIQVEFADGSTAEATLVAASETTDLALLDTTLPDGAAIVELAPDTASVAQGDPVVSLGHPAGLRGAPTLAWGLITAARRTVRIEGIADFDVLQATYRSAGGASGSPVFDLDGRVLGIHSAGAWDPEDPKADYLSSAVPIEDLHALLVAKRSDAGAFAAPPAGVPAGRARARDGRPEPTPSGFLGELYPAEATMALLRQHWSSSDGAHLVERVVPEELRLDASRDPIGRLSNGARYLEPLRVLVHRVDLTRHVPPYELASCPKPPEDPGDDPYFDVTLD